MHRIEQHPILPIPERPRVLFTWKGRALEALEGETLSSALFAAGVHIFGHHAKDGAPQGIFCANGQCSQCLVLADGVPVKSCMELVRPGVTVEPVEGLPELPGTDPRGPELARRGPDRVRPRPCFDHRRRAGRPVGGASSWAAVASRPFSSTTSTGSAVSSSCRRTASSAPSTPFTPGRAASTSPRVSRARSARSLRSGSGSKRPPWPFTATRRSASCSRAASMC